MADFSPRISFSHDLHNSSGHIHHPRSSNTPSTDFDFRTNLEASSYADDLFSNGVILPLPLKHTPTHHHSQILPTTKQNIIPSFDNDKNNSSNNNKKSFWRFGRSSSLNKSSASAALCRFSLSRSKSTGSSIQRSTSYKNNNNNSPARGAKIYYYSGGGSERPNGVRIDPVLNVPTPCSMNLLSFLLCSCGKN